VNYHPMTVTITTTTGQTIKFRTSDDQIIEQAETLPFLKTPITLIVNQDRYTFAPGSVLIVAVESPK
jgi:hypothetical protein